jgi:thiamine biosynthesis lipoprotein
MLLTIDTLSPEVVIHRRSQRLMGTHFEIGLVSDDLNWADDKCDEAFAEIARIEKLLTSFNENSETNLINRSAGKHPVKVSGELFWLIKRSLEITKLTKGSFDIVYTILAEQPLPPGEIKANVSDAIVLDRENTTVFLTKQHLRVGFGVIAKGYAADRARYILQLSGVKSGVINAGGDLLTWGYQPDFKPWTVKAADPSQSNGPLADIDISNMAIVTSHNHDRFIAINTKSLPLREHTSSVTNASVFSPTAEFCCAMASPVMALGTKAGLRAVNGLNQLACIIINNRKKVYRSRHFTTA